METRDPIRFWGGAVGAVALGMAIIVAVVVAQKPKSETASKPQPVAKAQSASKPQTVAKAQAVAKAPMAVKPLTAAQRKLSEELWVEQRKLDNDAKAAAATADGRRRIAETIAKEMKATDKLVMNLHDRKLGYGEITVALALSQQLMKREKLTHQRALDRVLGPRQSGQGWGAIARDLNLDLDDVVSDIKKVDKRVAKLEAGKR
ncbi:MAG TPA: hypothetical protein VIE36_06380 [Methylomirabilota bacterium]|jgi:hypothetical protein